MFSMWAPRSELLLYAIGLLHSSSAQIPHPTPLPLMKALLFQTWEERASVEEVPPSDWPVDKFLGHFLDSLLTWEDPVH